MKELRNTAYYMKELRNAAYYMKELRNAAYFRPHSVVKTVGRSVN